MIKTFLAATAVSLLPGLALAMGCSGGHSMQEAAMSCAEGLTFDAEAGKCVEQVTV